MKKLLITLFSIVLIGIGASYYFFGYHPTKEFFITVKEENVQLSDTVKLKAWTYNGKVPGEEIRAKQGDKVVIHVTNHLNNPTSIHWHGINVENKNDGVAGITQNAIKTGETFTYEFIAKDPGTYFYHSHQQTALQMDKGLYGTVIIEDKDSKNHYDKDYTVVIDEWVKDLSALDQMFSTAVTSSSGHDHGSMTGTTTTNSESNTDANTDPSSDGHAGHNHSMSQWEVFTINGKSGDSIEHLEVKDGDVVKLRLVNVGLFAHYMVLRGTEFKVTHTDGQEINEPSLIKNQAIVISPAERYDIEFVADSSKQIYLERLSSPELPQGAKLYLKYPNIEISKEEITDPFRIFDFTNYGKASDKQDDTNTYDINEEIILNQNKDGNYTLNGLTSSKGMYSLSVKKGNKVKIKFINPSKENHPMHLHGHHFQVVSKNGKELTGSPIYKDTILVKPNEEYEIVFTANNKGEWMIHCHDMHHAASGMAGVINYEEFENTFTPDPTVENIME